MKVRLLRNQKIWHNAGETVEVSPAVADFLLSIGSAEIVTAKERKTNDKNDKKTGRD
jgi:hypothetical protein